MGSTIIDMQGASGSGRTSGRVFVATKAVRDRVPLFVGLYGPTGSGKTFSALRLATGIQRVTGGRVKFIDTEGSRGKHHADVFDYDHCPFRAPFGSLDYLEALRQMSERDPGPIVVDSMTHEHEGEGGHLEQHEEGMNRLAGRQPNPDDEESMEKWLKRRDAMKWTAWIKPKADRKKLINWLLQAERDVIFCFRAKSKLKVGPGGKPVPQGWMPLAGEEIAYEMTAMGLLLPGAEGVPTWKPGRDLEGEANIIKLPEQFRARFGVEKPQPLSEDDGEFLARWAMGTSRATSPIASTKPASPRAPKAAVDALIETLKLNGSSTPSIRQGWIEASIGRKLESAADLTEADIVKCNEKLKE